jgi:hypothetical protein
MAEVRRNAGTGRLSANTVCCVCHEQFLPGQEYAVDRAGPVFFYRHLGCRDGAATGSPVRKPRRTAPIKKPIPDVQLIAPGVAEVFYRGHRYDAVAVTESRDGTGPVLWGLFHARHRGGGEPLTVERNSEVGLGGLVSWLLHNR